MKMKRKPKKLIALFFVFLLFVFLFPTNGYASTSVDFPWMNPQSSNENTNDDLNLLSDFGLRSITGADNFPANTISLSDVFRPAIGAGPNLMNDGKALQIVGQKSQTGAIWSQRQIDLTQDFSFTGYIYLGNGTNGNTTSNSSVADGVTMVFQNDPRMSTDPSSVLGPGGAALGVYSVNAANSSNFIKNAIALEFDPYANGAIDTQMNVAGSRYGGHVAVLIPQARNDTSPGRTHYGTITASPNTTSSANRLSNNTWRELTISWDSASQTLNYSFENFGSNSYKVTNLNTTFGGTKVYWGFTGATGGLSMDARIALTEIPGSASQNLQVENTTTSSVKDTNVNAVKGDTVKFTNVFQPDSDAVLSGSSASIVLELPSGLNYKTDTIYLDGTQISSDKISIQDGVVTISNQNLSSVKDYTLEFQADVSTDSYNIDLDTTVKLYSTYGSIWSTSNVAKVNVKKLGTVTYHYVDQSMNKIADDFIINGYVGSEYSEDYKDITNYNYESTQGNSSGVYTEDPIDVYFIYSPIIVNTTLNIKYVNELGVSIHDEVSETVVIGSTINLLEIESNLTAINELLSQNYLLDESVRPESETAYVVQQDINNLVYTFTGEIKTTVDLPESLNFGVHPIQYNVDEQYKATADGSQDDSAISSSGTISIVDTRASKPGWELKVKSTNFSLENTTLKINVGKIENLSGYDVQTLELSNNNDVSIASASSGTGSGNTIVPINLFEFYIPKETVKSVNIYSADIVWTLSDTPN